MSRVMRVTRAGLRTLAILALAALVADRLLPPDTSRLADSSTLVLDSRGELLRAFTTRSGAWRLPARTGDVDPLYLEMLLAYEDQRFRAHPGVDPLAALRAAGQLMAHRRIVSGASTLTMQAARLLEPRPRTVVAKLAEAARALQLETRHDKDEILSIYLTLAPFGGNLEGVRAASLAWFGKEPAHLAPSEAALLVALPQSPTKLRPDRYPDRAKRARDKVLGVMQRRGVLSAEQVAEAMADPVPEVRREMPFRAPHLARFLAGGKPALYRTTLDGELQDTLERLARLARAGLDPNASLAILVVDNESRDILAWVGSADFFDDDRSGQIDMVRAIRSPGSTLKPFIYAMALDDLLIHPETIVTDAPTRFGDYRPENFLRLYMGEVTVREALQHSLNVPAVAVLEGVGPRRVDARLRAAGVGLRYGGGGSPGLPLALGGVGVSLYDLVTLYAGLAEGGLAKPLRIARGDDAIAPGVPLFGEAAAWYIARILEAAPPPDGFVDPGNSRDNRRIAFKTGTSYGYRDAWALGYDGAHTVGVWVGRPDGAPSPDRFGRATAAPVLYRVFGLLPDGGKAMPRRPAGVIVAGNAGLPPALRRFGTGLDVPPGIARALRPKLAIVFPPDGAMIDLTRDGADYMSLPMVAEGGARPLRWLVNGRVVEAPPHRRRADWRPDGEGFVAITVIDAQGRTATSEVLLR